MVISKDILSYFILFLFLRGWHYSCATGRDSSSQWIDSPNPVYFHWLKRNNTVRATLLATLSTVIMMEVHDLLPAYDIWMTFRQRFLENSAAQEMNLREQLLYIRLQDRSMSAYLLELKSVADRLASIGRPLSSVELLSYTIRGRQTPTMFSHTQ